MTIVFRIITAAVVSVMTAWAAAAIYYSPLPGEGVRAVLAGLFVIATALLFVLRRDRRALFTFLAVFAALLLLWLQIPASNQRVWQSEVAATPYATINGDLITIHGVRNFNYRTETDFDPAWEDRTYDLTQLNSADLIAVYWAGKAIAHVMISFGFGGRDYVAFSIETRKERGESYSTVAGFFRQYELVYVVADERDVIGVRTTYRRPPEDVYLYRLRSRPENIRRVFLDYLAAMNNLRERPRFYNTLTTNCTTNILVHSRVNPESPPISWKILLSGYVPSYLYELGRLDTERPFPELERLSLVNGRAHAAGRSPAFSQLIREGLPLPPTPFIEPP